MTQNNDVHQESRDRVILIETGSNRHGGRLWSGASPFVASSARSGQGVPKKKKEAIPSTPDVVLSIIVAICEYFNYIGRDVPKSFLHRAMRTVDTKLIDDVIIAQKKALKNKGITVIDG